MNKDINMTKNKLNILFLLNEINEPILEENIAHAMIENGFMNYFSYRQYLLELKEAKFIDEKKILDQPYFAVTKRGRDTLEYFKSILMGVEKKAILEYIQKNEATLINYREIFVDYKKLEEYKYKVETKLLDKTEAFFSLEAIVPNKEIMDKIALNLKNNSVELYMKIMNLLMDDGTEENEC